MSAAAASLIQRNPAITPDQGKSRLMLTSSKTFPTATSYTYPSTGTVYRAQYDMFTVGAGSLDADASLASRILAPSSLSALSPTVSMSGNKASRKRVWCSDSQQSGTRLRCGIRHSIRGLGLSGNNLEQRIRQLDGDSHRRRPLAVNCGAGGLPFLSHRCAPPRLRDVFADVIPRDSVWRKSRPL